MAVFIKDVKTKRQIIINFTYGLHGTYAHMTLRREYNDQIKSFAGVLQNSYSYNFSKFHRKTPVLESVFNKFLHRYIPVKFARFLRTTFFIKHRQWLLLNDQQSV